MIYYQLYEIITFENLQSGFSTALEFSTDCSSFLYLRVAQHFQGLMVNSSLNGTEETEQDKYQFGTELVCQVIAGLSLGKGRQFRTVNFLSSILACYFKQTV
jgi:hypothetical protein